MDDSTEKEFITNLPHKLKQLPAFFIALIIVAFAWLRLCWIHGWHLLAFLLGIATFIFFIYFYRRA
jgi:hypothetical protein